MPELIIASIVLIGSSVGLGYFAVKKIPVLLTYPVREKGSSPKDYVRKFIGRMQDSKALHHIASPDILLQNVLSKTRIAALKAESKTGQILEKMRKHSQERNGNSKFADENYWKKLRRKKV